MRKFIFSFTSIIIEWSESEFLAIIPATYSKHQNTLKALQFKYYNNDKLLLFSFPKSSIAKSKSHQFILTLFNRELAELTEELRELQVSMQLISFAI